MLDALGQVDRVVGVSGRNYISNKYVTTHPEAVADIGFDGNIDYELLLAQRPDLVLLFGVSGASGMESKLLEMGIPFCYIGEYLEESPLGKAEWLVAIAEITDSREKGEAVFEPVPERYDALRAKVAAATSKHPKVMINTPYAGSWFMASTESYVARLIADAGGDYIYKKNTSNRSLPIDLEEAYMLTAQADMWLNAGSAASLGELKSQFPKFTNTRCVRNGAVYNCNKRLNAAGGNMASATVPPDKTIFDLDVDAVKKVTELNLFGTILPTMVFAKSMVESGKGSIINFASESALRPLTRVAGYGVAKAAVANWTKYLCAELAIKFGEGLRVNAIAPGFLLTNQNRALLTNEDGSLTARSHTILAHTPIGRFLEPDELVGTLHYLASDASKAVTGTVSVIDGGFDAFSI